MKNPSTFEHPILNEIITAQDELDALKNTHRQLAKDYLRKIAELFDFGPTDIFEPKTLGPGPVGICRGILHENPAKSRAQYMADALRCGVRESTANAQYSRIRKEMEARS